MCGTHREQRGSRLAGSLGGFRKGWLRLVDERVFDSVESSARADPKRSLYPEGNRGVVCESWC